MIGEHSAGKGGVYRRVNRAAWERGYNRIDWSRDGGTAPRGAHNAENRVQLPVPLPTQRKRQ